MSIEHWGSGMYRMSARRLQASEADEQIDSEVLRRQSWGNEWVVSDVLALIEAQRSCMFDTLEYVCALFVLRIRLIY